ncbi:MAG: WYL domain-containing protein [Deltaproteobacteria bacterium]|nr:WYL domain-containing protein [Deltaproteobacteria bacterium]
MRDVSQKIRRLLYIVPYVAKHPEGVAVDTLAKMLGAEREEMLADLELLSQVGPPDGDPGEYLLVSVEEGRVFVDLAHRLTRPLRLTPAEGAALLLGIKAMRESGIAPFDAAMQGAEKKLLTALGRDAREAESLATSTVVAEPDAAVASHLRALVTAARRSERVEIEYAAVSRAQAEHRPIDPYGIVHHAGEWYMVGHCHKRGDVRTFRIDRIAALKTTGQKFEQPVGFSLEAYRRERLYVPSADSVTVRIHLDPLAVTRIGANWPVGEVTMQDDGSAELLVDCDGFEWVTQWVLGLGRHAAIVAPDEAKLAMRARLQKLRTELAI